MSLLTKFLGILLILASISILVKPDLLLGWIEDNLASKALYIGAIVGRLGIGAVLILAAKASKFPKTFQIIGYIAILAAIIFLLIGHEQFIDFLSLFIPEFLQYAPVSGLVSLAFGGFLIFATSGVENLDSNHKH